jgi:hypothetical protein
MAEREHHQEFDSEDPLSANDRRAVDLERFFMAFLTGENRVWQGPVVCPVCKQTDWTVLGAVDLPIRYKPGRVFTMVPVYCTTCTNTLLFSVLQAGLFDEKGEPREAPSRERQLDISEIPQDDSGGEK